MLWQVQAASVGLVFALAVFVFGLLPQSRGRVTYREFLGRSWALPLVVFNIGSLLFTGLVLLGAGHQIPPVGSSPGHGWSITVASVASLTSVASILILPERDFAQWHACCPGVQLGDCVGYQAPLMHGRALPSPAARRWRAAPSVRVLPVPSR